MEYTVINMTNAARVSLREAYDGIISISLRSNEGFFGSDGLVQDEFSKRKGMTREQYLSLLALSIDKVPAIVLNGRLPRLEQTLARLDIVDGTGTEWGTLADALLRGLDLKLDKESTTVNFPNEEWGFKKHVYKKSETCTLEDNPSIESVRYL